MTSAAQQEGISTFRPRARILRTLGDELISGEDVAVIELVKNAYDADATRVLIRFTPPLEAGGGGMEILDNGQGMSLETVQTAWMEPATYSKRQRSRSSKFNRRVLGEKGIGRFAASRLAANLELITRSVDSPSQIRALFDWNQFDNEEMYLDEIQVLWDQEPPHDFSSGGLIAPLYPEDHPGAGEAWHGTIFRMGQLRASWDDNLLRKLRTGLSRLVSPFFADGVGREKGSFAIELQLPHPFEALSGPITAPPLLESPHYILDGYIDGDGAYDLQIDLPGDHRHEHAEGRFTLSGGRQPTCGPVRIVLRVWDRDQTALSGLAAAHGTTLTDVRGILNEVAGISVYRDGFRVLPYGERHNDWLRLDARRVNNPTLRLSNNQIVGYVLISADQNPQLRDQSNREGLIEGPALDDLRQLVLQTITQIETRRFVQRPRQRTKERKPGLFNGMTLQSVEDMVAERYPSDQELMDTVQQTEKGIQDSVEQIKEVISRYQRLATLGQITDTVLHDGRTPVSKIKTAASDGQFDLESANETNQLNIKRLHKRFEFIEQQVDLLARIFDKIAPFGGRRRGRPRSMSLEDIIRRAFSVLESDIAQLGAQVEYPETNTLVSMDPAEMELVIINLLRNSLYWLKHVPESERKIRIEVSRVDDDEVRVLFSDSGPGVPVEVQDSIFDPYFTTTPGGTGLGLTIAGDIVDEYYNGELSLISGGSLAGASFQIRLRKRV